MQMLKQWLSFVNNTPTTSQKLATVIFGCRWLGWKGISTWKTWSILQVPPVYFEKRIAKEWLWFIFLRKNHFIFSYRCSQSNFKLDKWFLVKYLRSFDQHTVESPWQCPFNTCGFFRKVAWFVTHPPAEIPGFHSLLCLKRCQRLEKENLDVFIKWHMVALVKWRQKSSKAILGIMQMLG